MCSNCSRGCIFQLSCWSALRVQVMAVGSSLWIGCCWTNWSQLNKPGWLPVELSVMEAWHHCVSRLIYKHELITYYIHDCLQSTEWATWIFWITVSCLTLYSVGGPMDMMTQIWYPWQRSWVCSERAVTKADGHENRTKKKMGAFEP